MAPQAPLQCCCVSAYRRGALRSPFAGQSPAPTARAIAARRLDAEVIQDALGGLAPLVDGGDHQVRAAHHVAAGEDLLVAGLEAEPALLRGQHPVALVELDALAGEPLGGG